MQNFASTFIKTVANAAEFPFVALKSIHNPKQRINKPNSYGDFTESDWKKVGNDMKRGLINFGQSK